MKQRAESYPQDVIKLLHFCLKAAYPNSMMKWISILALFCGALPASVHAKMADLRCDDSKRMTQTLTDVMRADKQGRGLRDPETMLEIWVTRHNAEWLIVQNYANGTSCIVAMGDHWQAKRAGPA